MAGGFDAETIWGRTMSETRWLSIETQVEIMIWVVTLNLALNIVILWELLW